MTFLYSPARCQASATLISSISVLVIAPLASPVIRVVRSVFRERWRCINDKGYFDSIYYKGLVHYSDIICGGIVICIKSFVPEEFILLKTLLGLMSL